MKKSEIINHHGFLIEQFPYGRWILKGEAMKEKAKKAGGKRKGAGRKKGEPTKAIGKRVPDRFHKQLVKMIEDELHRLLSLEN